MQFSELWKSWTDPSLPFEKVPCQEACDYAVRWMGMTTAEVGEDFYHNNREPDAPKWALWCLARPNTPTDLAQWMIAFLQDYYPEREAQMRSAIHAAMGEEWERTAGNA